MRNLKALGLALLAVFALSAVAASAASANVFTAESESAAISGDQTEEGKHVFTVEGSKVECETAHFETEGEVAMPTEEILVSPEYSGCKAFGFVGATIHTFNCHLLLSAGSVVTTPNVYHGVLALICTPPALIIITAGTCEVQIGSQEGLEQVTYTNQSGEVLIDTQISGISVNKTKDGFLCPLSGTGAATGSYTGTTLASGTSEGSPVGIAVEE